jgi:hypothetical protein
VKLHHIPEADVVVGREEFLKHGAGNLKNMTSVTPRNIFFKAMLFTICCTYQTPMGQLTFPLTLVGMLHTDRHQGSALPYNGHGLSHEHASAQWRLQATSKTAQPEDIHR